MPRQRDRVRPSRSTAAARASSDAPPSAAANSTRADRRAGQQAAAERYRQARRRRALVRWGLAAAAAIGVLAVVLLTSDFGRPDIGRAVALEGGGHVAEGAALPQRNRPPTSGPHYAARGAYAISPTPVEPGHWLHVLEHGGIVVLFKCGEEAECTTTADTIRRDVSPGAKAGRFGERKLAASPYQEMESPVAVLAWGRILELPEVDATQILAFYDRYLDRGPENVP